MKSLMPLLLLALAFAVEPQTKPKASSPKPAPKAKRTQPAYIPPIFHEPIEWERGETSVDIDCDGAPDAVRWGTRPVTRHYFYDGEHHPQKAQEVVIRLKRARGRRAGDVHIPFRKTTGYYGFCSGPKQIEREPLGCTWEGATLSGCDAARKCEALRIRDECSEFLLFWNGERKELSWVRRTK